MLLFVWRMASVRQMLTFIMWEKIHITLQKWNSQMQILWFLFLNVSKKIKYHYKNIQFISDNNKTKDENGIYLGN